MQYLKENVGASKVKLSPEEVATVRKIAEAGDLPGTRYQEGVMARASTEVCTAHYLPSVSPFAAAPFTHLPRVPRRPSALGLRQLRAEDIVIPSLLLIPLSPSLLLLL